MIAVGLTVVAVIVSGIGYVVTFKDSNIQSVKEEAQMQEMPKFGGGPSHTYQPSLVPLLDSTYTLGTTSKKWLNIYTDQICLAGTCKVAWPVGGGGSGGGTWSTSTSQVASILLNYPNNTTDVVVIGDTSTTTANYYIDPNINRAYLKNASTTNLTTTDLWATNLTGPAAGTLSISEATHQQGVFLTPTYTYLQSEGGNTFINMDSGFQFYTVGGISMQSTGGKYNFWSGVTDEGILDMTAITGGNKTFAFPNQSGTVCIVGVTCDGTGGGGADPFTHPAANTSATTSSMIIGASSTISSGLFTMSGGASTTQLSASTLFAGIGSVSAPSVWVSGAGGLYKRNTNEIGLTNGVSSVGWDGTSLVPGTTDARDLGSLGQRWDEIYGSFLRVTTAGGTATTTIFNDSSSHLVVKSATTTGGLTQLSVIAPDAHPLEADIVAIITPPDTGGSRIFEFDNQDNAQRQVNLTETVSGGAAFAPWIFQMCSAGNCVPGYTFDPSGAQGIGVSASTLLNKGMLLQLASSTASQLLAVDGTRNDHKFSVYQDGVTMNVSSTTITGLKSCDTIDTDASGKLVCGSDNAGVGGSGAWPFTPSTNYGVLVQATTTPEWFQNGMHASSTSRFVYSSSTAVSVGSILLKQDGTQGYITHSGGSYLNMLGGAGLYFEADSTDNGDTTFLQMTPGASGDFLADAPDQMSFDSAGALTFHSVSSVGFIQDSGLYDFFNGNTSVNATLSVASYTSDHTLTAPDFSGTFCLVEVNCVGTSTAHTWLGKQTFGAASTTDLTTSNSLHLAQLTGYSLIGVDQNKKVVTMATSTLFAGTNGQVLSLVNGLLQMVATSTCVQITGSAGLCDGDDASGGAGGGAWPFAVGQYAGQVASATSTLMMFTGSPLALVASTSVFSKVGIGSSTPSFPLTMKGTLFGTTPWQSGTSLFASLPTPNSDDNLIFWDSNSGAFWATERTAATSTANIGGASTAFGYNTFAQGYSSFAAGEATYASGDNAVAFGKTSGASGAQSFTLGNVTHATGTNSLAGGTNSNAGGNASFAFGDTNGAYGPNSIAIGGASLKARASYASVFGGFSNTADGIYSAQVGGNDNIVTGETAGTLAGEGNNNSSRWGAIIGSVNSIASGSEGSVVVGGDSSQATGQNAIAIGPAIKATANGAFVIGVGASIADPSYFLVNDQVDSLYMGMDSNVPTLVLPRSGGLYKTSNVGIATTSPYAKLSISANSLDNYVPYMFAIASSTPTATTTLFSIDTRGIMTSNALASSTFTGGLILSTGGLRVSTLTSANCDLKADTSGNVTCGTDANSGGGGGSWPFTIDSYNSVLAQSTTTNLWLKNAMIIASSTFFTQASSTMTTLGGTTWFTGLTGPGPLAIDSTGKQYVAATTTFIGTAPITASLSGNALTIACTAASNGVAGCLTAPDWGLLHTATTTFTSPLSYSGATNAVTIQNATAAQTGAETQNEFNYVHSATSTFSSPLVYTGSTNAVTCPTCYVGNGFDFSTANYLGAPVVSTTTGIWNKATVGFGFIASSTFFTQASTTMLTNSGSTWLTGLTGPAPLAITSTGLVYAAATTTAANPTASVGASSATNGSAATYMRSDAAPACTVATASAPGCIAAADFATFASKITLGVVFDQATNYAFNTLATSTRIWAKSGLMASSTSYFANASSTLFTVIGQSWHFGDLNISTTTTTAFNVNDAYGTNILRVSTASTTAGYDLLQLWSATSSGPLFAFDQFGHMAASSTVPTLSTCGTAPSITADSSDFAGTITVGSVAATACTLTFGTPHVIGTHCVISSQTGSVVNAATYTEGLTGFTYSQTGLTGDKLDYICVGK